MEWLDEEDVVEALDDDVDALEEDEAAVASFLVKSTYSYGDVILMFVREQVFRSRMLKRIIICLQRFIFVC